MIVYYIPNGPSNLQPLFPAVPFSRLDKYYLEVHSAVAIIATTTMSEFNGIHCDERVRIHYLTHLGTIDAMNFRVIAKEHETKSDVFQKPFSKDRLQHSIGRFNVKANDVLTLSNNEYNEQDMNWFTELLDSPFAFIEWASAQGLPASYTPVIILDNKVITQKSEERFEYEIILQIRLSHDKFIIRN